MKKIVLMSDSHYVYEAMDLIHHAFPEADYHIHCGDVLLPPALTEGWDCVMGNCDFPDYPMARSYEIEGHRILVRHGHDIFYGPADTGALAGYARVRGYDVVMFGHSHMYCDTVVKGVRLLNPGSVSFNKDFTEPSFMIVTIDGQKIHAERMVYPDFLMKAGQGSKKDID